MAEYEERQEDEVEFLQAVFPSPGDCVDLREKDTWKVRRPPELVLTLVPQKSVGGSAKDQRPLSVKLHTKYPTDYPDSVPSLWLKDPQGISSDQVKEVEREMRKLARERVGEVMMLEIAQHVMAFLHKHDRPPVSLHQEMVMRQKEEEMKKKKQLEDEELQFRMREVEEHRKIEEEIKRKEAELWQEERLGLNSDDDSCDQNSSADESSLLSPIRTAPALSLTTSLHGSAYLPLIREEEEGAQGLGTIQAKEGVKLEGRLSQGRAQRNKKMHIKRGKLLGESSAGGYSVYVGMDLDSGDLLAVYEWTFQSNKKMDSRRIKQVESIQQEFENFMSQGVHHPRLVQHLDMSYSKPHGQANKLSIELVMSYVGGGNMNSFLRNPDSSPVTGSTLSHYSKQLLEAVNCLHSRGIVHNYIRPSMVYFDSGGNIKLGGSNVMKRLSDLHFAINTHSRLPSVTTPTGDEEGVWPAGSTDLRRGKKGDIFRLGMVLLCLATGKLVNYPPSIPEHLPTSLRDFLAKCIDTNEQRRFPAHELLHHPFLLPSSSSPTMSHQFAPSSSVLPATTTCPEVARPPQGGPMHFQRSDSIFGSPLKPSFLYRSRLETEFEQLEVLGSGGFGDVIKVRHYLDARIYALKRIQTKSDSKIMHRITREVELLSQMNHENVVRYYNAWMETYSEEEYKRHSGTHLEGEGEEGSEDSDGTLDSDSENHHLDGSSIEFQNETFSFSSESSDDDSESDLYHSASEQVIFKDTTRQDALSPRYGDRLSLDGDDSEGVGHGREGWEDGVFMDNFSDSSGGSEEGRNVIGKLETQVMNLSLSKFRPPATESSDTVVFADNSMTPSKMIVRDKNEKQRERRRQKSSGQVQFLYIQMEYCEKDTLRQLIDSGDLHTSEDRVWRLFREVVEGLDHIHSKGMIHRDLKPGNIFLNSSGHIKIGDFGLAISYKHPINKSTIVINPSENLQDGESGLVGTAMYMAPELLKNQLKYTQKVDMYSLGIIFFEMCHPPTSTAMERHKMLLDIRKTDIKFPEGQRSPNQEEVIRLLLNHNHHERPSSKQLLQSPLLPLKMEDEELREVVLRTLQSTNSTRYQHLIDELFAQGAFRVSEFSYFLDPQDNKRRSHSYTTKSKFVFHITLLQQVVHSRLMGIFTHHGACSLSPPLLSVKGPLFSDMDYVAQFMDRNGTIVVLPTDHRIPLARYVCHQDISYLKRYHIAPVFRKGRVLGTHPKEQYECQFDIVSPNPGSLIADAEVMYVVSEVISELPGLQDNQFSMWISHTSLLSSILTYCSIPEEKHTEAIALLHKMVSGSLKSADFIKELAEGNIQLTPLASKTLLKFVQCEVALESRELQTLLDPLLRDKATGVSSQSSQAWQEITNVVSIFRQFGAKQQVYLHCGLCHGVQHFSGVIFQFVDTSTHPKKNKRSKRVPLAYGGRYDKLLGAFRRPGQQPGAPGVSVVGVTIASDVLLAAAMHAYFKETFPVSKCSVLVCWLGGRESLQKECLGLVRDLWAQGISADILYESMEIDNIEDIQKFCREYKIPHVVVLGDKALYFERKQVKLRILESSKVVEKLMTISELMDFLQQKHHTVERSESLELKDLNRAGGGAYISEGQSTAMPQVNITVVVHGKLTGHLKRRYHDQTINKLLPLFQKFSMKQQLDVIVVDLKLDILCSFSAEINKLMAGNESDLSSVARTVCERHSECNKKYVLKICYAVEELLNSKKKAAVVFLYSHLAEFCQVICNSLESLTMANIG